MTDVEFESEAFLRLLTDALRSGPASPEWREALQRLREQGMEHGDEYQLLITAREHLESGKGYRSIRAGPEFTRNLMNELERESIQSSPKTQTTLLVAVCSAGGMLLVLLVIGYLLWNASGETGGPGLLVNTVATVDMAGRDNPQWRKIGALQFETGGRGGMRMVNSPQSPGTGGGLVWDHPVAPGEPFSVQVTVRAFRPDEQLWAQVFVTDDPNFDPEKGTPTRELVWLLQGRQAQVILPSGRVETQADSVLDGRGIVTLRMTIDGAEANVEMNRAPWWKGAHLLDPDKPRYVGVRFVKRDPGAGDSVVFSSIRVNMRQP